MFLNAAPPSGYRGDGGHYMVGECSIEPGLEIIQYNRERDGKNVRTLSLYDDDVVTCSENRGGHIERRCTRMDAGGAAYVLVSIVDSGVFGLDMIQVDQYRAFSGTSTELHVKFNGREKTVYMFNKTPKEQKFVQAMKLLEGLVDELMN